VSPPIQSANRTLIRQINEAVVLGLVHEHGEISRTELATLSNLSPATITGIISRLIRLGLVREVELTRSTGGRPRVLIEFARDAGTVIGVKLTESHLVGVLTDLGTRAIGERTVSLGTSRTPDAVADELADLIESLRAQSDGSPLLGVGVGLAGAIDRRAGICRFSPYLPWRDVPLAEMVEARVGHPVVIENDVSALVLAERWFGSGADLRDFIVITLGRGVGLGMVLDGRPYRGGNGGGGEFGHITMEPGGPLCDCGKRGCLEALVGERGLARDLSATLGRDTTLPAGADLARSGDDAAREIFTRAGATLGLALSGIINVLNPTRVMVSGEGTEILDLLLEPMRTALQTHCFDGLFDDLELIVDPASDVTWACGAAGLVLDDAFHARLDLERFGVRTDGREVRHGR
jgi:N-acetylglucosamine repressor